MMPRLGATMSRSIRLLGVWTAAIALAALTAGIAYVGWRPAEVDLGGVWQLDLEAPVASGAGAATIPADLLERPARDYALIVGPDGAATIPAGVLERVGLEYHTGQAATGTVASTGRGVALELVDQGDRLRIPLELEGGGHLVVEGLRLERR
jgi:hypothetical protein